MTFIERITALTEEKGIKEKQVLADCGLNKNQFGLWRQGRTPNAASQKVLADYFGVSVEYLMGKTDDRGQKKSPAQMDGAGVDDRLREIWNDSTEAERKAIVDFSEMIRGLRGKTE